VKVRDSDGGQNFVSEYRFPCSIQCSGIQDRIILLKNDCFYLLYYHILYFIAQSPLYTILGTYYNISIITSIPNAYDNSVSVRVRIIIYQSRRS